MITVESFKDHFYRDFPYLPLYVNDKAYFIGEVVYVATNFYESVINGNLSPVIDTAAWKLVKGDISNYLQDKDIEKAIEEAQANINQELFVDILDLAMLYLTAYYLVLDIKNSTAGFGSNAYAGYVASKSVGNVSESYAVPSWVSTDPMLGLYMDNGYGKKYLTYLLPRIRLNSILLCSGGTTT